MATTIEQISGFLQNNELKFRKMPDRPVIVTGFQTEHYVDSDGDNSLRILIELAEEGEFIKVLAPVAYSYKEGPHKAALFQTLLQISWTTKMVQFEYDADDGEVRAIIEFPLEDAILTERQLMRTLSALAEIVDESHEQIKGAMDKGLTPETRKEMAAAFEEFMRQRRSQLGGLSLAE